MNLVIDFVAHVILFVYAVLFFLDWREEHKNWQLALSIYAAGSVLLSCIIRFGGAA
jgi:hypothetical protein